jgi:hypothetical protein
MGLLGLLITRHTGVTWQASWNNSNKMGMGTQTKPWRNTCRRSVACSPGSCLSETLSPASLMFSEREDIHIGGHAQYSLRLWECAVQYSFITMRPISSDNLADVAMEMV